MSLHNPHTTRDGSGSEDAAVLQAVRRMEARLVGEVREMREEHIEEMEALRSQISRLQRRLSEVLLTPQEAAARLGISTRQLRRWRADGKISPVEEASGVRYHPDAVARLAEGRS